MGNVPAWTDQSEGLGRAARWHCHQVWVGAEVRLAVWTGI